MLDLLGMFDGAQRDVKSNIASLFAVLCCHVDAADVTIFATEAKIRVFGEALGMDDPQLSDCVVRALVRIETIGPNVAGWVDRTVIEEAAEDSAVEEECRGAAAYMFALLDGI